MINNYLNIQIGTRYNYYTTIDIPFREGKATKVKCKCDCGTEKLYD